MHVNHINNLQGQKPIKQNWLKATDLNKNPKISRFEIFNKNAWNMWINWKRKGKSDLQALEDKNPWEI